MARSCTAHLFSTLNGVNESPNLWQFDAFGPEEGEIMGAGIGSASDVVIGRTLFGEWNDYWPNADDPFGNFINPVRKHVVTTTLKGDLGWNATAIDGEPVSYVKELKESDGGGVLVVGGIDTVRALLLGGVIDELTLTTHPVVTPRGKRLFDESTDTTRLTLIRSQATKAGNVISTYALRTED